MSRLKSGAVHHIFPSALPNGSSKTRRPPHIFCMFDTVFHEADETYYIVDVLAWNGVHLCDSSLDCRSAWARCQFSHSDAAQVLGLYPLASL
jgi:snurportin-1